MSDTLKSVILKYAVNATGRSEEHFRAWFEERQDNYLNYILRTAIPPQYTYDGVKTYFVRKESENTLEIICIFWYLENARCLLTALKFNAFVENGEIKFNYSILPKSIYDELLQNDLSLESVNKCEWPAFSTGSIKV